MDTQWQAFDGGVVKESGTKNQYYSIESVQEDTRLEVVFENFLMGTMYFSGVKPCFRLHYLSKQW